MTDSYLFGQRHLLGQHFRRCSQYNSNFIGAPQSPVFVLSKRSRVCLTSFSAHPSQICQKSRLRTSSPSRACKTFQCQFSKKTFENQFQQTSLNNLPGCFSFMKLKLPMLNFADLGSLTFLPLEGAITKCFLVVHGHSRCLTSGALCWDFAEMRRISN